MTTQKVKLKKGELQSYQHLSLKIDVCNGELWITLVDDLQDYTLGSDQGSFYVMTNDNVVIEALEDCEFEIGCYGDSQPHPGSTSKSNISAAAR